MALKYEPVPNPQPGAPENMYGHKVRNLGNFQVDQEDSNKFQKSPGLGNITENLWVSVTVTGDWWLNSMDGMGEIWTLIFTRLH